METYKSWIVKTGIVFTAVLLLLTFFSNTIYHFNLTSVTVAFAQDGVIRETASGEGIVSFGETQLFYAPGQGRIQLLAGEGDNVEAGQELYRLITDEEELEKSLENAKNEWEKTLLKLDKISDDIAFTQKSVNEAEKGRQASPNTYLNEISSYEYEIENLNREISQKKEDVSNTEILYHNGTITQNELLQKQNELEKLENSRSQAEEKLKRAEEAYSRSRQEAEEEAEKDYRDTIDNLQKSLQDLAYQKQDYLLDKNRLEHTIQDLEEQMGKGGVITISAEKPGKITETTDIENNAYVSANSLIMKIGATGKQYYSLLNFPEDTSYIHMGDTLNLHVKSHQQYNIEGIVKQVFFDEGYLKARVEFTAEGLSGGEQIRARAESASDIYGNVLPNTAVRYDPQERSYYFLYAEKVKSLLGYEYYARKMPIHLERQDDQNTGYRLYTDEKFPVIINSDGAVNENDRIRIAGGSDIVEIR